MPADAFASLARLRKAGSTLAENELKPVRTLDALLLDHNSEFQETAELTASALAIEGRGRSASPSRPRCSRAQMRGSSERRNVRYWPLTDISVCTANVRYWGKADIAFCGANVCF